MELDLNLKDGSWNGFDTNASFTIENVTGGSAKVFMQMVRVLMLKGIK